MAHKGAGIEPIVIVVAKDEDVIKIVQLELIEAERELDRGGADEDRHFGGLFHFNIVEVLRVLEEPGAEEEFPLIIEAQAVIIAEMAGYHGMVERLVCEKPFELMFCVESLKKGCDRTI
jgi:hypothetical protein